MTIYTLLDGSEVRLPDGLSEQEANNIIAKAMPGKAALFGISPDIEREYDVTSGVSDFKARFDVGLAGSPEELKNALNQRFGKDGWGISDWGQPYATPIGLRRIGQEPKDDRKVLLDGIGNNLYDVVDIIPEIATGVAATAAELLIPVPGTAALGAGAVRGFLSGFGARQLAARSIYAGGGDFAANIGLEGVQTLQGNQRESLGEILSRAGTQGAAVAGMSFALGLPLAAIGPLAGKITDVARKNINNAVANQGVAVSAESAIKAREAAAKALWATGKYAEEEQVEAILPLISLKHQLGDTGTLAAKFATVLEGIGAKQLGDQIPAKALTALERLDELWRSGEARGLAPYQIAEEIHGILSKNELNIIKKTQENIETFYNNYGLKTAVERDRAELVDLLSANVDKQLKYGMKQFDTESLYKSPELQLDNLSSMKVDNGLVADAINNIAKQLKVGAENVLDYMSKTSGALSGKLNRAIEIKEGVAVAKTAKETVEEFGEFGNFAEEAAKFMGQKAGKVKEDIANVTARDIHEIDREFRNRVINGALSRNELRQGLAISEELVDILNKVVNPKFSTKYREVNNLYKQFITPFNRGLRKFEDSTAQGVEDYVKDLVQGRKGDTFTNLVSDLEKILSGIPEAGGKAAGILSADEFLGEVAVQYMRRHRDLFGLSNKNMAEMPIETLRANAKKALNQINQLRNTESTANFKKAFDRLFKNDAFEEYRKALSQLSAGNPKGLDKLRTQLSFEEAAQFVDRMSNLGNNLSADPAKLAEAVSAVRGLKSLDPKAAEYFNLMLYSQIFDRVLRIGGAEPGARNSAIKAWADDIVKANNMNQQGFKELLGEYYQPIVNMGNMMQGALNIDPTAGAISAAGQPFSALRGLMNGAFRTAIKPVVFMYTVKQFAPGGTSWAILNSYINKGAPPKVIEKALKPTLDAAAKKAQRAAALSLAGRDGLFAASISAYLQEADMRLPPENTPIPQVIKRSPEEVMQERQQAANAQTREAQLAMQQQLGASIMQMMKAAQSIPGTGTSGLAQGAKIAAGAR